MYSLNDLRQLSQATSTQQRFRVDEQRASTCKDICLRGILLSFGSLVVLKDAQIRLAYGTKYALVGRNGIGKTTLLRCMAARMIPQWTHIRTYLVQQEHEESTETALHLVQHSDPDHQALLREIADAETDNDADDADRLVALYEQLASSFDDSEMERRAAECLTRLHFTASMMRRPYDELSGGWRMKAQLACALFYQPQLLLLDEPTNHLDVESTRWLSGYVRALECTVIVVSHDRDFLDAVAECVIHLTQRELRYYAGNYSAFAQHRQEKLRGQQNLTTRRGGTETSVPRVARMSKRNLADTAWVWGGEAVLVGDEAEDDRRPVLHFPQPDNSVADPIVQLHAVSFAFGDRVLWRDVDLCIDRHSRIAIIGPNGVGKSTLLRCVAGLEQQQLLSGNISRHHNLRTAVFTQHLAQEIDLAKTPLEYLLATFPDAREHSVRGYLGSFGICGDRAVTQLRVLSGGQRTRFLFALLMYSHPHLLLLDEPTSHLDMEMTEALIAALREFQGAYVVVSHHGYFLRSLDCQFYAVDGQKLVATTKENCLPLNS